MSLDIIKVLCLTALLSLECGPRSHVATSFEVGTTQAVFESGVFFLQLFTSKDPAYKTCKPKGITQTKWEIHVVSSALVEWFVFLAYSVVIFKLSATSKLDLNECDSKLACKIQLNHHVSSCICILRFVTKIGVNAVCYYRTMEFLGSVS